MSQLKRAVKAANVVDTKVGTEDMVLLQDSKDNGIVDNLKVRLTASQIYTYIGPVLIVCNPYKWLNIYDDTYIKKYKFQIRNDAHPHIFMTAEAAYRGMINEEENQCIIISGESGAGKTEASKQIQNYIAAVSGSGAGVDALKETFLRSNPVLEAFGNAKTLRNNNSSRFGKYFELKFDHFGSPKGGVITNYLLEKSRIVSPGEGERGFHIFYQMLTSAYVKKYGLTGSPKDFSYLSTTSCITVDGVSDSDDFEDTVNAMRSVGMNSVLIDQIFALVAIVLHLGNIRFVSKQEGDLEGSEISKSSLYTLQLLTDLANMDMNAFVYCLTHREMQTMAAGGKTETYQVPQNPVQASARRDAVAKAIYERLFDMIVLQINQSLDPGEVCAEAKDMLGISVLDIYGFEIFQCNGFEQMCINYVNEKLQQIFIDLTLRAEQDEYTREGIQWTPIPFFNNRIVCDLLDASKPSGLFLVLDDTCKTMHGSKDAAEIDRKFVETAAKVHGSHAHFSQNSKVFTIKHYAGEVVYTLAKFGETNKDSLNKDLILMIQTSTNPVMKRLFGEEIDVNNKKAAPTVGYRIRTQCQALITALMCCSPHYVRCIKSNDTKQALSIDTKRVQHQVKYLGLAENIKVRRAGYAYRAEYHRFIDRFGMIELNRFQNWNGPEKDVCKELLKVISSKLTTGLPKDEAQLGRTMIFIRTPETYLMIEQLREKVMNEKVMRIQKAWRSYCQRRVFINLQITVTKLFKEHNKMRRRESFMRPYFGDYLTSLCDRAQAKTIQAGVSRVIHFYNKNEQILFADTNCFQVNSSNQKPSWKYNRRILVLTDLAIYLLEYLPTPAMKQAIHSVKAIPDVILRRRIDIQDKPQTHMAVLESYALTTLSDACFALFVKPMARLQEPHRNPQWPEKNSAKVCSVTGKSFTMFEWKKRCKVTGDIMVDAVCDFEQSLPDTGYYTPARCGDQSIGLVSTDQAEDVLLYCDKRTEFIALLSSQWKKVNTTRPPLLFINDFTLRAGVESTLSRIPARKISFAPMTSGESNVKLKKNNSYTHNQSNEVDENDLMGQLDSSNSCLRFSVAAGVSSDIAERRRVRQMEQQRQKEEVRAKDLEMRKQRNDVRAYEREQERLARIKEKKERKRLESLDKEANDSQVTTLGSGLRATLLTTATATNSKVNPSAATVKAQFNADSLKLAATGSNLIDMAPTPAPAQPIHVTPPQSVPSAAGAMRPPPPPPPPSRPAAAVAPIIAVASHLDEPANTSMTVVSLLPPRSVAPVAATPPPQPSDYTASVVVAATVQALPPAPAPAAPKYIPIPVAPTAVQPSRPSFPIPALRTSPSTTLSADKAAPTGTGIGSPVPAGQHLLRPSAARSLSGRESHVVITTAAAATTTITTAIVSSPAKDSIADKTTIGSSPPSVPGRHLLRPVQLRSSPLIQEASAHTNTATTTESTAEIPKEPPVLAAVQAMVVLPPTRPSVAPSLQAMSVKPMKHSEDVAAVAGASTAAAACVAITAPLLTAVSKDELQQSVPIVASLPAAPTRDTLSTVSNAAPAAVALRVTPPTIKPSELLPAAAAVTPSVVTSPLKPAVVAISRNAVPPRAAVTATPIHPLQKRPPVPADEDDDEVADNEWDD